MRNEEGSSFKIQEKSHVGGRGDIGVLILVCRLDLAVILMKQTPEQQNQCMLFPPGLAFVSVQALLHSSPGRTVWSLAKTA